MKRTYFYTDEYPTWKRRYPDVGPTLLKFRRILKRPKRPRRNTITRIISLRCMRLATKFTYRLRIFVLSSPQRSLVRGIQGRSRQQKQQVGIRIDWTCRIVCGGFITCSTSLSQNQPDVGPARSCRLCEKVTSRVRKNRRSSRCSLSDVFVSVRSTQYNRRGSRPSTTSSYRKRGCRILQIYFRRLRMRKRQRRKRLSLGYGVAKGLSVMSLFQSSEQKERTAASACLLNYML